MPSPSLSVDELTDQTTQQETPLHQITQQETTPQRSQILEQADMLLTQAQDEYQLGLYSDAEESLISALSTVRSGDTGRFISPFESQNISSFGRGDLQTFQPIDNLYTHIINGLALGNESAFTITSLFEMFATGSMEEVIQRQINTLPTEYYRDAYKIELEALRLLQKILIKQDQPDKVEAALEVAEEARNLESIRLIPAIGYALNNDVRDGRLTDSRIPELVASRGASIEDVRHFAENEETTLVYYSVVSEAEIIVWVIQPNGAIHAEVIDFNSVGESLESVSRNTLRAAASYVDRGEEDTVLVEALRDLQLRTNEPDRVPSLVSETDQISQLQRLYQLLISPIEEYLPNHSGSKIVFIPQRELSLIPFAALKTPSGEYLIDRFSIRISPNPQYLLRDSSPVRRFPRGKEILIVGNPTNSQVVSLPGAEQEARLLALLTGSYPLIGSEADQNNVSQKMENVGVIHLATHGILDALPPLGDTILLIHNRGNRAPYVQRIQSTANSSGQGNQVSYSLWPDEDGTGRWHVIRTNGALPGAVVLSNEDLTSQYLLNRRLNADLVVLSACNTARGIAGESTLLGLPMALGLAGVPQVVVSLWAVPDASTQELMFEFYSAMREQGSNIDVADALRKAMLEIKSQEEYRDPIYWAGFTVIDASR